jgi:hypothetical protein
MSERAALTEAAPDAIKYCFTGQREAHRTLAWGVSAARLPTEL